MRAKAEQLTDRELKRTIEVILRRFFRRVNREGWRLDVLEVYDAEGIGQAWEARLNDPSRLASGCCPSPASAVLSLAMWLEESAIGNGLTPGAILDPLQNSGPLRAGQ